MAASTNFYFRRESRRSEAACHASTYMKPGVVMAIRGSRNDVVEAIVGAILVQWRENDCPYRTIHWHFSLLSLTARLSPRASSFEVSACWRFARRTSQVGGAVPGSNFSWSRHSRPLIRSFSLKSRALSQSSQHSPPRHPPPEYPWSPLTASRRRFSPQLNQQHTISPV